MPGLLLLGMLFVPALQVAQAAISVSWDPVDDDRVAQYEVHFGSESRGYAYECGTGDTQVTVPCSSKQVMPAGTNYFAVRSCNQDGSLCSAFSDEVSITIGETGDTSAPSEPEDTPQRGDTSEFSVPENTPEPIIGCSGETLWPSSATPEVASRDQTKAVELGVKFRADRDGYICGLRFYKGPDNTGTHLGSLWRADGTLLAQATFTNETATGWQQVDFAQPVAIAADTVYVASYHAPNGGWAYDRYYFAEHGYTNGSLTALSDGESGGNGPYLYGSGGFPTYSSRATNYWVDVVFTAAAPDAGSAVLEYGEVTIDREWHAVSFNREYADPVVIAQSLSANGSHPSVVRITDVDE